MVDPINRKLSTKPVDQEYLVEFINKELVPVVERLRLALAAQILMWTSGEGSPEGIVEAPVAALYQRTDGAPGTLLYQKQTGIDATGWVAVL
jgi:hypothetical protein